jgi:calcineurin-like phosphoesterase family protein
LSNNIWFTSDHHFGHKNIITFSQRPFQSVAEMNKALIHNWNSVVGEGDLVYHLGDMFWTSAEEAQEIRNRLKGRIRLIRGNHDSLADSMKSSFEWIKDLEEIKVEDADALAGQQRIVLCHCAMRVWNKPHHDAWHLYGHSHGSLADDPHSLSFDVGVDCHRYTPISYAQVKAIMQAKHFVPVDYHGRDAHYSSSSSI